MADYHRGHRVQYDEAEKQYRYTDTGEPLADNPERPCGHCGRAPTPEGHDACLGALPGGVDSACCGHGHGEPWVRFAGIEALAWLASVR